MYQFKNREQLVEFIANEVINTAEAAEILDCSRQYIHKLVKQGKLMPIKEMQKDKLFLRTEIEKIKK